MSIKDFWQSDEDEFRRKVASGKMAKRLDGTYVEVDSIGARPGFNSKVQSGSLPASNTIREYSEEVAETFFRDKRAVKTAEGGYVWRN